MRYDTYYTQNAHGDVVNLTDKDGKVTKSYKYDAFGVEKNIDENDINAFRYCGEYYDKETATVYLRARYYNPKSGRFISRDSFAGRRTDPLSLNLYTYCGNNPIYYIDPNGHSYAELLDGTKMSINGAWDAKVFNEIKSGKQDSKVNNKKSPTGISEKGIEFLKQYESFEPQAYLLEGEDYYTIGYGHQIYEGGTSVVINGEAYDTLTEELATTLFMDDINSTFAPSLNKFLSDNQIVLNQNQYDA
ncbi:MAG: hypothetical protein HFG28_15565 [Eubacterium sp.]|nr:hypothetical protein [Eubacterium sp.]